MAFEFNMRYNVKKQSSRITILPFRIFQLKFVCENYEYKKL
jgi:hypothetical protein